MSKTTIRVVARIVAISDKAEEVKSVLLNIIEPTRKEEGCIVFELLENQENHTDFTFVEEWESQELWSNHMASVHIAQAVSQLNGLLAAELDIRTYRLLA